MRKQLGVIAASMAAILTGGVMMGAAEEPPARFDGHKVVRVQIDSARDLLTMQAISPDTWQCGPIKRGPVDFRVPPDGIAALEAAGIPYEVMIEDVQALIDAERARLAGADQQPLLRGPGDYFDDYRTIPQISAYVDQLIALRPDLASRQDIGQSLEGRTLYAMRITSPVGGTEKPIIFLNALQHAREWITGSAIIYLADRLVRDYGVDPAVTRMLDNFEFVLVPVMNPDGYEFTWTTNRLWRKNRRPNAGGTFGVDNNRNWGIGWGGEGSSNTPSSETYRGTGPFSEPETQVMRNAMIANPRILMSVDIHSFSQLILSPWGYTIELPLDTSLFDAMNERMQQAFASVAGRYYAAGPTYTTIYPASGGAGDWAYGARNVLGWCYELRPATSQQGGFVLPPEQIIPASQECFAAVAAAADWLLDHTLFFNIPGGVPERFDPQATTTMLFEVRRGLKFPNPSSVQVYSRIGRQGPFASAPVTPIGSGVYRVNLTPGRCGSVVQYYLQASTQDGATFTWPPSGAMAPLETPAETVITVLSDGFETDLGWTAGAPGDTATSGIWERGTPVGTTAQPSGAYAGANCYFTGQHPGGGAGANDVDGGFTTLISPIFDCSQTPEARLSYVRWYSNNAGASPAQDVFTVRISNNGGATWTNLEVVGPGGPHNGGGWNQVEFRIADVIAPTAQMRVRFIADDQEPGSLVEAAVDEFLVRSAGCSGPPCPGDWDRNGVVNSSDISFFITGWLADLQNGTMNNDVNGDGVINSSDISEFITQWIASLAACA